jgi:hypothetical protein
MWPPPRMGWLAWPTTTKGWLVLPEEEVAHATTPNGRGGGLLKDLKVRFKIRGTKLKLDKNSGSFNQISLKILELAYKTCSHFLFTY